MPVRSIAEFDSPIDDGGGPFTANVGMFLDNIEIRNDLRTPRAPSKCAQEGVMLSRSAGKG